MAGISIDKSSQRKGFCLWLRADGILDVPAGMIQMAWSLVGSVRGGLCGGSRGWSLAGLWNLGL